MADKKISQLTAATTPLAGSEVLPIVQSGSTVKVSVDNLTAGKTVTASKVNVGTAPASTRTINVDGSVLVDRFASTPQLAVRGGTDSTTGVEFRLNLAQSGSSMTFGTIGALGTLMSWDTGLNPTISGNLVIGTSGKGIDFSATPDATATSELLADYEEGTWTITLYDASSGGNASATTATGYYTKIGRQVTATFSFITNIDTTGMTAGNALYFSLPYTPAATIGNSAGSCSIEQFTFPAGRTVVSPVVNASGARGYFRAFGSAADCSSLLVSSISTGVSDIEKCTITYFA